MAREKARACGAWDWWIARWRRANQEMWTRWNTPDEELFAKVGPGEVARAVAWSALTAEQKAFQRTKMAIHAAMITRMDLEIGEGYGKSKRWEGAIRSSCSCRITARVRAADQATGTTVQHHPDRRKPIWVWDRGGPVARMPRSACTKSWVNEGWHRFAMSCTGRNGLKDAGKLRHDPATCRCASHPGRSGGRQRATEEAVRRLRAGAAPALRKDGKCPASFCTSITTITGQSGQAIGS